MQHGRMTKIISSTRIRNSEVVSSSSITLEADLTHPGRRHVNGFSSSCTCVFVYVCACVAYAYLCVCYCAHCAYVYVCACVHFHARMHVCMHGCALNFGVSISGRILTAFSSPRQHNREYHRGLGLQLLLPNHCTHKPNVKDVENSVKHKDTKLHHIHKCKAKITRNRNLMPSLSESVSK